MNRLIALAAGAGLALGATAATAETYALAVTDVEGLERLQVEWGPFKEALEEATGDTFEFFAVNSRTAAAEALRAERVDFVVSGPAEYIVINELTEARPLVGLGRPDYFCAIIVMADSGITEVSQLKGERIALSDVGSTSGHLCPMDLMADYGVMRDDVEITHTSRNVMHEALKRGDVAAIGYNHNSWVSNARDKDEATPAGAFRIIARSGDLPNDMIMVGAHVEEAAAQRVRDAILQNRGAIIDAILAHEENNKYAGMDLVAIEDDDYNRVRDMYTTAGFPQFDSFIGD